MAAHIALLDLTQLQTLLDNDLLGLHFYLSIKKFYLVPFKGTTQSTGLGKNKCPGRSQIGHAGESADQEGHHSK